MQKRTFRIANLWREFQGAAGAEKVFCTPDVEIGMRRSSPLQRVAMTDPTVNPAGDQP
jgi:hypothetical protein